ncbi:MAG: thioredoxin domain-containing protein [Planctomycetota bacterium]
MKSPITKLAVAGVVIAAAIFISRLGDSINGASVVWAKVIETIENAHTLTSREKRTLTCEGKELPFLGTSEVMKYASSEYGVREDMHKDGQPMTHTYWLLKENECVNITPMLKQYKRKPLTEAEKRVLHQMTPDGIANLIRTSEYVELGRKTIDGVDVEGLEIRGPDLVVAPVKLDDIVIRMWVDVETYLPVVIEAEAVTSDKYVTVFTSGKPVEVELLAGEFQWDVELDSEIFEPNIPDDYTMLEE